MFLGIFYCNDVLMYIDPYANIKSVIHLGHEVSTVDKNSLVSDGLCKFWKAFNLFMADFGHIDAFVKCKVFKIYCCS